MTTNFQPDSIQPPSTQPRSTDVPAPPFVTGEGVASTPPDLGGAGGAPAWGPTDTGGRFGVKFGTLLALGVGYAGMWCCFFTPVIVTLQLQVRALAPNHEASVLSTVLAFSGLFSLITNPIAGLISDRTTSRFGRRRPWMLIWMCLGIAGLALQAFAPNVPVLIVGSVINQIGFAGTMSVMLALLPDLIPARRRGTVSAVLGISQSVGIVAGAGAGGALAGNIQVAYLVPAGMGLVALIFLILRVSDPQTDRRVGTVTFKKIASSYWVNPRRHPDFGWAWVSRFAMYLGFAAANNYLVFYLSKQLGMSTTKAAATVGLTTAITAVCVIISSAVAGSLSDRLGRRRILVAISAVIGLVGLSCYAVATTLPVVFLGAAIIGIAQGAYAAVDLALVTEVLPDVENSAGTHLGVITIANQLPQTLAPAFAPALLAISFGSVVGASSGNNYTMLFAGSAVCAAISAVTVFRIRGVR